MRKLRLREVKSFAQSPTAGKWQGNDSIWGLPDSLPILVIIGPYLFIQQIFLHSDYVTGPVLGAKNLAVKKIIKNPLPGISLVVQRLRLHSQCRDPGFDPWSGN